MKQWRTQKTTGWRVGLVGASVLLATMLVGCPGAQSALDELVLDDQWQLSEIKTGSIITTNLNDYITVTFDSDENQVTYETGSAWPSAIDVAGTFDYVIDGAANQISLSQGGTTEYTISYEFDSDLGVMTWTRWVEAGSSTEIVGNSANINYIKFDRS